MAETPSAVQPVRIEQALVSRPTLRWPVPIAPETLTASAAEVISANDEADLHVMSLVATNLTGADRWVSVYVVPDGGSVGTGNAIALQLAVPSRKTVAVVSPDTPLFLGPGDALHAVADQASGVNLWGTAYEYRGEHG